jgi:hypothetical protein
MVCRHNAELMGYLASNGECGDRRIGAMLEMDLEQTAIVHLIDMIARQDQDMLRGDASKGGEVLVDGICRALIADNPHPVGRGERQHVIVPACAEG